MYKQLIRSVPFLLLLLGLDSYAQSPDSTGTQTDTSAPPPKKGFLSSLGDTLKQPFDPKAVRGYFDVSGQRYYCLIDTKTGANQANAVRGQLVPSGNGRMTLSNVTQSLMSCDQAETDGKLVLNPEFAAKAQSSNINSSAGSISRASPASGTSPGADGTPDGWVDAIDIGGIKLGMSINDALAALKSRNLIVLKEFRPDLGYPDPITKMMVPIPNTQFVSALLAASVANTPFDVQKDWEIIWILFTPDPGNEHVVQIHRTVNYAVAHAVRETDLDAGLFEKYQHPTNIGPYDSLMWALSVGRVLAPQMTPTCHLPNLAWDVLAGGEVPQVQTIYSKVEYIVRQPSNPVLVYPPNAWSKMGCVTAELKESHQSPNSTLPPEQRVITQFDVNALSLSVAADAAKVVAKLTSAAADAAAKNVEKDAKKQPGPVL
jgi:hypothetical protein